METELGGYFLRDAEFKPGNCLTSYPRSRACWRVETRGEKRVACENSIMSGTLLGRVMALA